MNVQPLFAKTNRRVVGAILIGLATIGVACGPITLPGTQLQPAAGSSNANQTPAGSAAQSLNELSFSTMDGGSFRLSEQRGHVVGVFVMASWCDTCVPSAAAWDRLLVDDGPRGLTAIGISGDPGDTPTDLAQFATAAKVKQLNFALDPKSDFVRLFHVVALDATFIFDRSGNVVFQQASAPPYPILRDELEKLL